jgi:aminoglycoside phosphotransferase (APT) family kinase protein
LVSEDYLKHLAGLHDRWIKRPTVVAELVAEVASAPVVDIRRVVEGEANEVYDVTMEGAPSLIVRISHGGPEALQREAWVLGECASRDIRAPRVHALRHLEVEGEQQAAIVMEKVQGERLCDVDLDEIDVRRVLGDVGAWLSQLHSIPVRGFGNLDGYGVGKVATMNDGLTSMANEALALEEAGRSVGLEASTVRSWLREIVDSFQETPPRVAQPQRPLGQARRPSVRNHRLRRGRRRTRSE